MKITNGTSKIIKHTKKKEGKIGFDMQYKQNP